MAPSWRVGTIRDIPIEIHPSLLVAFFLVTFTLAAGLFPMDFPGLPGITYWLMGSAAALLFFGSVLVHELGHSFVALHYGIPIRRITLFIFGGVAHIGGEPERPAVEFQVAIAGPLASLAVAGVLWLIAPVFTWIGAAPVAGMLTYLTQINVILAVFNMVPAFPLDGGRVLRALLWSRTQDLERATRTVSNLGQLFAVLLIVWGISSVLVGAVVAGLWTTFIGLFLHQASQSGLHHVVLRQSLAGVPVSHLMSTQVTSVPANLTVADLIEQYFYGYRYSAFPVLDNGQLIGMVSVKDVRTIAPTDWERVPVRSVVKPVDEHDFIDASADAADAIMQMAQHNRGRLLVMEAGQIVGLISHTDVLRLIQIQQELRV